MMPEKKRLLGRRPHCRRLQEATQPDDRFNDQSNGRSAGGSLDMSA
jgi:hypothetical protein